MRSDSERVLSYGSHLIRYILTFPRPPGSTPLRSFPRSLNTPHALLSPVLSFRPLFTWQRCMDGAPCTFVLISPSFRRVAQLASSLSNFVFSISHAVSDGGICSSSTLPPYLHTPILRCPSLASLGLCDVMRGRSWEIAVKFTFSQCGNLYYTLYH